MVTGKTTIGRHDTAETSAVMLAYLDATCKRRKTAGQLTTLDDLIETVHVGPWNASGQ